MHPTTKLGKSRDGKASSGFWSSLGLLHFPHVATSVRIMRPGTAAPPCRPAVLRMTRSRARMKQPGMAQRRNSSAKLATSARERPIRSRDTVIDAAATRFSCAAGQALLSALEGEELVMRAHIAVLIVRSICGLIQNGRGPLIKLLFRRSASCHVTANGSRTGAF